MPLGHHYPGHLLESRRHQVVRTGRPTLPQTLLQQGEGSASVAAVGLYLPGEQQGLEDPDAYPMRAEQLQRLGQELVRPVEVAPHGRSQGEAVERVTGPPGVPDLPAHVQALRAVSLEHGSLALVPEDSSKAEQGVGRPAPVAQGAPTLQDFRVGGLSLVELAAFLRHQPETEGGGGNHSRVL